jgi:hypothetical protein
LQFILEEESIEKSEQGVTLPAKGVTEKSDENQSYVSIGSSCISSCQVNLAFRIAKFKVRAKFTLEQAMKAQRAQRYSSALSWT